VVWIVLVAVLLAGIVAVNVAALRLNLESQRLEEQRDKLIASNADVKSELSGLAAAARVEATGKATGLVPAAEPAYVRARRGGR
jgi:cell division protein FtsL